MKKMGRPPKICTPDEINEIVTLYIDGNSAKRCSELTGIGERVIKRFLVERRLLRKAAPHLPHKTLEKMIEMYRGGATIKEIASKLDIYRDTVAHHLKTVNGLMVGRRNPYKSYKYKEVKEKLVRIPKPKVERKPRVKADKPTPVSKIVPPVTHLQEADNNVSPNKLPMLKSVQRKLRDQKRGKIRDKDDDSYLLPSEIGMYPWD